MQARLNDPVSDETDIVCIITTGGTLDKRYNPVSGALDVGSPVVANVLAHSSVDPRRYAVISVCQKDSLDLNDEDRYTLFERIKSLPASRILVTHGTDTMAMTAQCLAPLASCRTIVLVGAMTPCSMDGSDAAFNLGFAYSAACLLPFGLYIAMHGRVLPYTRYKKDRSIGRFISGSDD